MFRCIWIIFRESWHSRRIKLPEDDAGASKRVGRTIYEVLVISVSCAFVGVDNRLYKVHSTCIKLDRFKMQFNWTVAIDRSFGISDGRIWMK